MGWCGRQSIKRLVDLITAASALTILAPLLGLIALAVWLIMSSPILFRLQRRT
jgi:lipopolysaccharide/colanic/teichoic acid biosynthesis glycosyltransferase